MTLSAPTPALDFAGSGMDPLSESRTSMSREVAEQFEAVFVSLLLKQMRQSFGGESLIPSDNGDVIGGMFDLYLGQDISQAGGVGVADMLERYVQ